MGIAEGVRARVAYKFHSSGTLASNAEAAPATEPGASGGQILRRVSSTLNLNKEAYQSDEVVNHLQINDFRHGVRRAAGDINGELSPLTYQDWMEAVMRGTWAATVTKTEAQLTSVVSDNATSMFTFGGGDPVTEGFRVGDTIRFSDLAETANNAVSYLITAFGGTSNREVTVYPAPTTDAVADATFTVQRVGRKLIIPESGHVKRLVAVEHWFEDLDIARLYTECRVHRMQIAMPAQGMSTVAFGVTGRGRSIFSGVGAPFFTSPAAITTTGISAAVNGLLRFGSSIVGVVTSANLTLDIPIDAPAVAGQVFPADILLGRSVVTGQITALLEDDSFVNPFDQEAEVELLLRLQTSEAANAPFISLFLPRLKLTSYDENLQGDTSTPVTFGIQGLKKATTTGYDPTTLVIQDSESA